MSRVFRVRAKVEMIVIVEGDAEATVDPDVGLILVKKSEELPYGSRFDAQAVVYEGISEADCGSAILVRAGDIVLEPIEELGL